MDAPQSLTREQARAIDRHAMEQLGIPGIILMENASIGASQIALEMGLNAGDRAAIYCGGGNNGGDGYAMARHLFLHEIRVSLFAIRTLKDLNGDAAINAKISTTLGIPITIFDEGEVDRWMPPAGCKLVVDALLGTGFEGTIEGPLVTGLAALAAHCDRAKTPILAVDVPSGLDVDHGTPDPLTVRATHTVTFVAPKVGFENPRAQPYLGQVSVVGIGAPCPAFRE